MPYNKSPLTRPISAAGGGGETTAATIAGAKNLIGTTDQVVVTNGVGVLVGSSNATVSLPQSIATTSSPSFAELTLADNLISNTNGKGITFKRGAALLDSGASAVTLTGDLAISGVLTLPNTPLAVASGGSGATSDATAPWALKGSNTDITSANSMTSASSLATVGTITSGVWNGTSIGTAYLPANQTQLTSAANLVTVGTLTSGSLGSGFTTVAAGRGGTGFGSYAVGDLLSADTTSTLSKIAAVTSGRVLLSQGANTQPAWSTLSGAGIAASGANSDITSANSMTSASSLATVGTITSGTWTATAVAVANGGTGATTAAAARTNLGVEVFESTQQTITTAGALTLAHGLGRVPKEVWANFVCLTAEAGYSIGDVVVNPGYNINGSRGFSCVVDSTNLNIRYGSQTPLQLLNKTTGTVAIMTSANWAAVFYAR